MSLVRDRMSLVRDRDRSHILM